MAVLGVSSEASYQWPTTGKYPNINIYLAFTNWLLGVIETFPFVHKQYFWVQRF